MDLRDSLVQPMLPVGASPDQGGEATAKIEELLEKIAKHTKPA